MLFNSLQFLCFFSILAVLYFIIQYAVKKNAISQLLLLGASLYFYASWKAAYLVLILISITITWTSGLLMEKASLTKKRLVLVCSLVSNLAILFFFKYADFFGTSLQSALGLWNIDLQYRGFNLLLPVGISFYTFQALGYTIDVFKDSVKAERNFITYALFVTFFPQLVAGPIERTGNLLPQFKVDHAFEYERVTDGLKLAAWGMFKKVVIADQLAVYVNIVYNNIQNYNSITIALATFFFAFQILGDFSGYSDIAIGVAKVLGFNLMTNFKRPYFSKSIAEFWRRWHISFSTWFKDYVYIPLGGSRAAFPRRCLNLGVTFLVSGLWHGANWTFVIWGALHGFYQIISLCAQKTYKKLTGKSPRPNSGRLPAKVFKTGITFLLVCFAWIFFRANSLQEGLFAVRQLTFLPRDTAALLQALASSGFGSGVFAKTVILSKTAFLMNFILIFLLAGADILARKESGLERIKRLPVVLRWVLYYALIGAIYFAWLSTSDGQQSQFIYFQF